jgi:SRSO17 transposase
MGERFVVDLHSDFQVYLEPPKPYIPEKDHRRGRKPTRYKIDEKSITVKDIVDRMGLCTQPVLKLRDTTRGKLKVRVLRIPVYIWDEEASEVLQYFLVATQTIGKNPETKISLSNVPDSLELKTLAWMQLQRYWVERAFEDAKSECGMADYQVRKWSAWHHHMALVVMAMLFMLNERILHKGTYPMLSCADIEDLLSHFLPRRM